MKTFLCLCAFVAKREKLAFYEAVVSNKKGFGLIS